ncbi:MAG TPA: 2-amino-4-hydroxy-6-hydroxymethyldihydropteridine diphosphokinase [Candidatus Cybelea sp.]|nr:2-amino-4-hydroxy-6-hydroxymethyldihydropteridine diphosphokinase [Candidatus Cybelea sp.]
MTAHLAYVGLGSNLGDRAANLERAREALRESGTIVRSSALYRTKPWGRRDQPEFFNAVVLLETRFGPHELLDALRAIERRLGRAPAPRWGPRAIDLDLLLFDELIVSEANLRLPHERLAERAFVLVPLAELDDRFAAMRDALDSSELAGVVRLEGAFSRSDAVPRESGRLMSSTDAASVSDRVRALAAFLSEGDAVRVRIQRGDEEIELTAPRLTAARRGSADGLSSEAGPLRVDTIKADLVGIFHLGRPAPAEGELLDGDRELGFIEALGIRTPIHSMGSGRLVSIAAADDAPVEYGQPLFSIARG